MASEQKLQVTDENQSGAPTTNEDTTYPPQEQPSSCASDYGLQGEPATRPVTASPEDRREEVEETGYGGITGGEQVGGDGAGKEKATGDITPHPVTEVLGNKEEVHVGILVSLDESSPLGEGADQGTRVTGEATDPQGTGDEKEPQETGRETEPQVTGEETDPQGTGDEKEPQETGRETEPQVTGEETDPQGTGDEKEEQVKIEETCPQSEGTDPQNKDEESAPPEAQMSSAGEKWIDMLVHTIVTEVTGDGVRTGEPDTGVEAADAITVMKEHSAGTETMTGGQVTLQGAGAAVQVNADGPVSTDNIDIALRVRVEEAGAEQVTVDTAGIDEQIEETASHREESAGAHVTVETAGIDKQVEETASHREDSAGAQVTVETAGIDEQVEETASHREESAGAQVTVETAGIDEHVEETASHREESAGAQVTVETAGIDEQVEETASHREESAGAQVTVETAGIDKQVEDRDDSAGAQVTVDTAGIEEQVEETASHREESAGAQVTATAEEVQEEIRSTLAAGGQVIASGAETDREVTPDLDALSGREGIADQDQPVACREKEWPSLICTASEVRTVTAEQGDSQQGSVTPEEPSDATPEMKEREIIEDGYTATPETPIEREIRLTMERELTLRQERGINSPVGNPEFVEVRRRTISVEPAAVFGKERQLAGAQMQREIQLETQREQDLVELGQVMGTYDRGPQQELQEKKMIFESMNTEPSDVPIKKKQNEPQQQPKPQEAPPSNIPAPTNHVAPARETKKGPSYTEANGSNVIIIEHSNMLRRSVSGNPFSPAPADSHRSTPADYYRPAPADSRRSTQADYYRSAPADSLRSTPAELPRTNWSGSPLPNSADSPVPPGSPYQLLRSPSPRSLLEQEIEEVKERERELQRQRSSIYGRDDSTEEATQKKQEIPSDVQSVYQPERPNWGKLEVNWPPNKEAALNGQQQVLDSPRSRPQRIALIQSWESGNPNPKDDE